MLALTLATIAALLIFVIVLVVGVTKIMWALERIGSGPTSSSPPLLGRIRWGVRAIERQTEALAPFTRHLATSLRQVEAPIGRLRSSVSGLSLSRTR